MPSEVSAKRRLTNLRYSMEKGLLSCWKKMPVQESTPKRVNVILLPQEIPKVPRAQGSPK